MFKSSRLRRIIPSFNFSGKNQSNSASINIEKLEQENEIDVVDDESKLREEEILQKRNKSGLKEHHRNILFQRAPFKEPTMWFHNTLKYNRSMYGKYGEASGVNKSICWPTKEELDERVEYESFAYNKTIQELVTEVQKEQMETEQRIHTRQQEILENMGKLNQWKKELKAKIEKKEKQANAAKQQKERLVEEVRRHFGYTVDPNDEKFKEMLEKKEKEQKKAMKQAKKKAKEERMISTLLNKQTEGVRKKPEEHAPKDAALGAEAPPR